MAVETTVKVDRCISNGISNSNSSNNFKVTVSTPSSKQRSNCDVDVRKQMYQEKHDVAITKVHHHSPKAVTTSMDICMPSGNEQPMLLSPLSITATDDCNNSEVDTSYTRILEQKQQQLPVTKSLDAADTQEQQQQQQQQQEQQQQQFQRMQQYEDSSHQARTDSHNNSNNEGCKLFVGGLPKDVTAEEFHDYFVPYGEVLDSFIVYDRENGKPRGFGFVTFSDADVCRKLLNIYHQKDAAAVDNSPGNARSTKEEKETTGIVAGDMETSTTAKGIPAAASVVARLQMRGRYIELKIAQPRDAATTYANNNKTYITSSSRPPRRSNPYQNHHHQFHGRHQHPRSFHNQYQYQHHHYYHHHSNETQMSPTHSSVNDPAIVFGRNGYSRDDDGSYYNHVNKVPATLAQQQLSYNASSNNGGRYAANNSVVSLPPIPITPGGPLIQQPMSLSSSSYQSYKHSPIVGVTGTPGTPAQKVLDIAHHMLFYAQLLATPSMPSTSYDDLYYRHPDEILRIDENSPLADSEIENANTMYMEPSQPPPRPCTPSLSVPDVIVSPSKKRSTTSEIFKIGGGTFYPDVSISTSSTPIGIYSPSKVKKSTVDTKTITAEIPSISTSSSPSLETSTTGSSSTDASVQ